MFLITNNLYQLWAKYVYKRGKINIKNLKSLTTNKPCFFNCSNFFLSTNFERDFLKSSSVHTKSNKSEIHTMQKCFTSKIEYLAELHLFKTRVKHFKTTHLSILANNAFELKK